MFPVRCFTCGKVINMFYDKYVYEIEVCRKTPKEALDKLNITRYCCRSNFISYNPRILDSVLKY